MTTLKLELTIEQVNAILQVLGGVAYIQSAGLINLIQDQVGPQVREMQIAEAKALAEQEASNESTPTA